MITDIDAALLEKIADLTGKPVGAFNIRKDSGFEVTDKIRAEIEQKPLVADAIARFAGYIASQTLAVEVRPAAEPAGETVVETDVDDEPLRIAVTRI